jgi:hypothetical protein
MQSRFKSICATCKQVIGKGEEIIYFPYNKSAHHFGCAETDYRAFEASAIDEYNYNKQY